VGRNLGNVYQATDVEIIGPVVTGCTLEPLGKAETESAFQLFNSVCALDKSDDDEWPT
jgi:hypothetical protein